jgi:hypothetical protein
MLGVDQGCIIKSLDVKRLDVNNHIVTKRHPYLICSKHLFLFYAIVLWDYGDFLFFIHFITFLKGYFINDFVYRQFRPKQLFQILFVQ